MIDKKLIIKILPWLCFFMILGAAFWARSSTLWSPHWRGDQSHYISLAMKLDQGGLDDYNLRRVNINYTKSWSDPDILMVYPTIATSSAEDELLKVLGDVGFSYYDEPLHMRAPMFPWMIMWAHRLFSEPGQPFIVNATNIGKQILAIKPKLIRQSQMWIVVPHLALNISLIILTFILGIVLSRNTWIALLGSIPIAFDSLGIWLAHRLLNETLTTFFITIALILLVKAYPFNKNRWILFAGLLTGMAILTNQRMGLFLLCVSGVIVFLSGLNFYQSRNFRDILIGGRAIVLFALACFLVCGFWFWKVYQTYGDPLHIPSAGLRVSVQEDITGWSQVLLQRPHTLILYSLWPVFYCPTMAFFYGFLFSAFDHLKRIHLSRYSFGVILCLAWVLVIFFYFSKPWYLFFMGGDKELRYIYPIYPAVSVLSGIFMLNAWKWIRNNWNLFYVADGVFVASIVGSFIWALYYGRKVSLSISMLM